MTKSIERKLAEVREWVGAGTLNFFGIPFAGKDTQADKLASYFGVQKISSGEILRNSHMPVEIRAAMDRGEIIPTEHYRDAVLPFLGQAAFKGLPLLLSSVGRMKGEEKGVLAATEAAGHSMVAVPFLEITAYEAYRRLKDQTPRGRADDNPESLGTRLEEFEAKTLPVINAYSEIGLVVPIDAMGDEECVFKIVVNLLHERAIAA